MPLGLCGCLTSDAGEAVAPCSSPTPEWVGWIDAGWSTDCSHRYISKGDHLCLSVMMGDPSGLEADPASAEFVMSVNGGNQTVPTVLFADGAALTNPSIGEVKARLGR